MNLQSFFLRGAAATMVAGAAGYGAFALMLAERHVPASQPEATEVATAPSTQSAVAPKPAGRAAGSAGSTVAAANPGATTTIPLPNSSPPATTSVAAPPHASPPTHPARRVAQVAAPRPAARAVAQPIIPSVTSRQNADKFVHTRVNGTGAVEQPGRQGTAAQPYDAYYPAPGPVYPAQPWYYRRVY